MKVYLALLAGSFAVAALFGCSNMATQPAAPAVGLEHFQSKQGGGGNVDTNPRAIFTYNLMLGTTVTGLYGDGKLADGTLSAGSPSVYQGDLCGVQAEIFVGNTGDGVISPGKYFNPRSTSQQFNCGGIPRVVTVSDPSTSFGPVSGTFYQDVHNIWPMISSPVGTTELQDFFVHDVPGCGAEKGNPNAGYLTYSDQAAGVSGGAGQIVITYLGTFNGVNTLGQPVIVHKWSAQSQYPHTAGCLINNAWIHHTVPFSIIITEVPYAG